MVNEIAHVLEVRGVTFGYGRQPLFNDVHLQVRAGEMVGLLGPNGAGKTTLLRLLSGVLSPQQGQVLLEGRDLQQWGRRGTAQHIAVVPQELHVPFAFTVEHMVSLGRTPFISLLGSPTKHDRAIIQQAMSAAEVTPLAGRVFNELSGGERQRVLVAMALAQEPRLLLLDEPTSHLDIKYQIDILELVQRLNRELSVTVVASMHDLNLAARYFPRLVLFQHGIVADAGPTEVLEPRQQAQVHVMAGGGSGELLMRALADAHVPFVAGALNIADSDHTLALHLAEEVITEQPYAPISPAILEQVRSSLAHMALLILCPVHIGPGNLALLREAVSAASQGVRVLILAPSSAGARLPEAVDRENEEPDLLQRTGITSRDYINGEGVKLVGELLQAGATVAESVGEAIEI